MNNWGIHRSPNQTGRQKDWRPFLFVIKLKFCGFITKNYSFKKSNSMRSTKTLQTLVTNFVLRQPLILFDEEIRNSITLPKVTEESRLSDRFRARFSPHIANSDCFYFLEDCSTGISLVETQQCNCNWYRKIFFTDSIFNKKIS